MFILLQKKDMYYFHKINEFFEGELYVPMYYFYLEFLFFIQKKERKSSSLGFAVSQDLGFLLLLHLLFLHI